MMGKKTKQRLKKTSQTGNRKEIKLINLYDNNIVFMSQSPMTCCSSHYIKMVSERKKMVPGFFFLLVSALHCSFGQTSSLIAECQPD